jgi:YjjG family noncanonical pyrimidine nucleotidase
MNFLNKKHIFFDLDHTLWDFDKNSAFAFEIIFEKHQIPVSVNLFIQHYVPLNQQYWKLYQTNQVSHEHLRYYRLKDSFDALNYLVDSSLINQLSEDYIQYLSENNHLFDGALEVLDYLSRNYKLHIITNGFSQVQTRKLQNANIAHYFATVTNSEMAGVKKPHPTIFNFALSLANASIQESIMIGDSIEADIQGALSVGMDAIFFNEQVINHSHPVMQIQHLLELKNFF